MPTITSYSSTGGNPFNKDNDTDVMYLASQNDIITFNATVNQSSNFEWSVNKDIKQTTSSQTTSQYIYTIPNKKGIFEIYLRSYNSTSAEATLKWVLSTLSSSEAPEVFEYFADGLSVSRIMKDPWNRNLLEWNAFRYGAPLTTKKYFTDNISITDEAYIETSIPSIVKGTFKFWMFWNNGGSYDSWSPTATFSVMDTSYHNSSIRTGFKLENPYDEHLFTGAVDANRHLCDFGSEGNSFSLQEYPVNVNGWTPSAGWHQWTCIVDENEEIYIYIDDWAVYSTRSFMDRQDWGINSFKTILLALAGQTSLYHAGLDGIEGYNYKYIFPPLEIYYDNILDSIILKNGNPNIDTTPNQIYVAINNISIFDYNSISNTYTSKKPIIVERGGTLRIENCTFIPYSKIRLENSSNLIVNNATITSTIPYKLEYVSFNDSYQVSPLSSFILRTGMQKIEIKNSTIDNASFSQSMSPYIIDMDNSNFTRMQSPFVIGQNFEMGLIGKFNINNIKFSGELIFENVNQYPDYYCYNEYLVISNIETNTLTVQQSGTNSKYQCKIILKNVKYNSINVIESLPTNRPSIIYSSATSSYYADILVIDSNGIPIPNVDIIITNTINTSVTPINLISGQHWIIKTFFGCCYKNRSYFKNDNTSSIKTSYNGKTPPPSDMSNTVLLTGNIKNAQTTQQMSYSIQATYQGTSKIVTNISPNSTWYRTNPSVPTNTITIQLPVSIECPTPLCNIIITQL